MKTALLLLPAFLLMSFPALAQDEGTAAMSATVSPARIPPGSFLRIGYNWKAAKPLKEAYSVFVHFIDSKGRMAFQGDHLPPVGTGTPGWLGDVGYEEKVLIPESLPEGEYKIVLGLYTQKGGRLALAAGEGVKSLGDKAYQAGSFIVDKSAPKQKADTEKAPSLNLDGYKMVFNEDFKKPLDVSAWGPGTRWIAHTPWRGDFGDAAFADPKEGFPFKIQDGALSIEARKGQDGKWRAGLLCSSDLKGNGFSLQYGYFEMRAKMPPGPGVWPAFWLTSNYSEDNPKAIDDGSVEIDVIEYYGHNPSAYTATVHVWKPEPHIGYGSSIITRDGEASSGFHNYGVMVQPDWITMYFDGIEVWKAKTPKEHKRPLRMLLNLALGSGWSIDKTPNPSFMLVEHVRAYAK